jgi:hypothetical protein
VARAEEEAERQRRRAAACAFLRSFYEADVASSRKLEGARDRELVRERTAGAATARAGTLRRRLAIVVGEQGEIDIGGKSLGRHQAGEATAEKRELIAEIISHFSL